MKAKPMIDTAALSPMQAGMLFHNLSGAASGIDVEQIYCTTPEALDPKIFERAWQRVVDRHEILRTTFHWTGLTKPVQRVQQKSAMEFLFEDWQGKSSAEQKKLFDFTLQADRERGFNLTKGPPLRVALFRLSASASQFIWTIHHLLVDGRSVALVLNEVFAFYEAFVRGQDLDLPPLRPFREYVDWLEQQDWTGADGFWRQTMKGFAATTPLGIANHPKLENQPVSNHGEQETSLSSTSTTLLKSLAKKNGLTLNTLLLGAWSLLLSRYSGEDDVVFGVIRAGRRSNVPNAGAIVGMLINTVPLRIRVAPEMTVLSWLNTVRAAWYALRDFEHTPLVNIQADSDVPHGQPLFETIINYQDPSWDAVLRAQGGNWTQRDFGICSKSNYPLVVDAYGGQALGIKILYHRNRLDDASITRMLGHLKTLLESMAAGPDEPVAKLPMLTDAEREQILVKWNNTAVDFPEHKCVHELFEEQVRHKPYALAVADGKRACTYAELNERADLLAAELRKSGIRADDRVGICLDRSMELVAAMIAVWKAGGAYVPLDPSYPPERLAFMVRDAKMAVLLTSTKLRPGLQSENSRLKIFCLDETYPNEKAGRDAALPACEFQTPCSKNLAYVIYTSGSTGQPKGVAIEHRSVVNLIAWHQRFYQVTPNDRASQIASPSFDASVWELWPYLAGGASIHIPDEETRLSPRKLLHWLVENKITLTFIPTPIAEAILDESWPENCQVRALLTGGDKLHRPPGQNLPFPLTNHYGPTENTVVTTSLVVPPSGTNGHAPPIGRPIDNAQAYVLDKNLQPVPIGVTGELHIGGTGLARGYHHRPGLTAEKFIPNPFSMEPGARLYKSGDLVRWLPDGAIEFLGRLDNQVKIRGQRIETGEIEAVLRRHPNVGETLVTPRENAKGEIRLAAYVVPKTGVEWQPEVLREYLRNNLPGAMVPSAFVQLSRLPLTANGKVDRKALPAPEFTTEAEYIAPRTAAEQKVAEIWCEVLGAGRVGVYDNFFELGGHSLTATQVVGRLQGVFKVEIPVRRLFETPTVAGLAGAIDTLRDQPAGCTPPPLVPVLRNGVLPLSFAQERLWFLDQLEPGLAVNNIPIAIRLDGSPHIVAMQKAVNELLRRHETFRTAFRNENGRPAISLEEVTSFAIPVIDLSALPEGRREAESRRLMMEEARQPFQLAQVPLLRVKLLRLGANSHLLLLTTHHIACDGWSLGILYLELAALYEAFSRNQPSSLPQKPVDYMDFAAWQRGWLKGEVLDKSLGFWKEQLSGASTTLDLPTDRPRPPVQTYRGAMKLFKFPQRLAASLNSLARRENATLFMLLIGALETLLHRYTGQEDILIGSPVAGRRVETEKLAGLFLNMLVLRGNLSGDPTFRELLQRVRQTALNAYAHQDLPFEKLVDAIQPTRDLSRSPLFQVMFVLQNEPLRPLELAGLKLTPEPVHTGTAKFDLMLSMEEGHDGLNGFIEYNSDLFDEETIGRLIGHFQTILEAVATDAEQRISKLPLLTKPEQQQILHDWNDTQADFPREKCIHELIEEQARLTPSAIALICRDRRLTYYELNEQADQLARKLKAFGVQPDTRVGICINRSIEMMIGLFGILKAGGAYVPLDPAYPMERLSDMLRDSEAPVIVTHTALRHRFDSETSNLKILCVDEKFGTSPTGLEQSPSRQFSDSLAYVMYTSGSTGQPKGVMVTHRNVVNFFTGMNGVLGTKPGVWLAVTSISFDISVLELFWTLARGFTVVVHAGNRIDGQNADGGSSDDQGYSLPAQIIQHGVTHMQCTPSLAGTLVIAPASRDALRRLEKLLVGGEALPLSLANQLGEFPQGEIINMYGPTETTIWSTTHRLPKMAGSILIGRPIANTQIYILDNHLQPVPLRTPGEIFISGEGVARGYHNRPELTSEKFIRNPFSADGSSRLYRTGDIGRWLPGGVIEHLGRADHQVKIRGHRIELGEIETVLGRHPAVHECVVVAREDSPGDKRLIAYIVSAPDVRPSREELRRFAGEKLPEAMIPSGCVFLDKMPLTPNGKINRKALPAPEMSRPELETVYLPPHSDSEVAIAKIWQELLHVEKPGMNDNFFDLGGNSLLVVQAQARLRETLGCDLPVVKLFQYPNIRSLASFLDGQERHTLEKNRERGRKKQMASKQQKPEEILA